MAQARSWFSRNGRLKNTVVPKLTAVSMPSMSMSFRRCTGSNMPVVGCGLRVIGAVPMPQPIPLGLRPDLSFQQEMRAAVGALDHRRSMLPIWRVQELLPVGIPLLHMSVGVDDA